MIFLVLLLTESNEGVHTASFELQVLRIDDSVWKHVCNRHFVRSWLFYSPAISSGLCRSAIKSFLSILNIRVRSPFNLLWDVVKKSSFPSCPYRLKSRSSGIARVADLFTFFSIHGSSFKQIFATWRLFWSLYDCKVLCCSEHISI